MPRAKASDAAETKAPAKPASKLPPHPLFPGVDAALIHSLWLYRMVKSHPKAKPVAELVAGPMEPTDVQTELHIVAHGPGVWKLMPKSSGGLILGESFDLRVRDDHGRVPELVSDFDRAEAPAAPPSAGGEVAAMYRDLMAEQRKEFERMRAEDKAREEANFATFGSLLDRSVTGFQSLVTTVATMQRPEASAGVAGGGSADWQWFRKELEGERRRTTAEMEQRHKLELELAERKARRSKGDGGELGLKDLLELAPMVASFFRPAPAEHAAPSSAAPPPATVVIEGVEMPSAHYLRAWQRENPGRTLREGLNGDAWATFEDFHRRGVLPADIAAVMGLS